MRQEDMIEPPEQRSLNQQLIEACRVGFMGHAMDLIAQGAQVNARAEDENLPQNLCDTPLLIAAKSNSTELASALLSGGANVNVTGRNGRTPLHEAAVSNALEALEVLLKHGAHVDAQDTDHKTPLVLSIENSNPGALEALLAHGADVHRRHPKTQQTPLHEAVRLEFQGRIHIALLEHGSDVNAVDAEGCTPLHRAVQSGGIQSVRQMLEAGAHVNALNGEEQTALDIAVGMKRHPGKTVLPQSSTQEWRVLLLVAHGADTRNLDVEKHPMFHGLPALHAAVKIGSEKRVFDLLKNGADAEAVHRGKTARDCVPHRDSVTAQLGEYPAIRALLDARHAQAAIDKTMKNAQSISPNHG